MPNSLEIRMDPTTQTTCCSAQDSNSPGEAMFYCCKAKVIEIESARTAGSVPKIHQKASAIIVQMLHQFV